jgi:poly[(R)-3-hydroxyalkanoate] polymerase subunit PhaC
VTVQATERPDIADTAAPLDALLIDAALGSRRFLPDASTAKLVGRLLRQPRTIGRRLGGLAAESVRAAVGRSTLAPDPRDRRFTDTAWTRNPVLHRVLQTYLAATATAGRLVTDADLGRRDELRAQVLVDNLTPGSVVLRTEQLELIQYRPQTTTVRTVPVLIVPPTINKYYALDLAPGRSLVEYLVGQGLQVFVVSWRNPDARHADWGFDTYVQAILDALDATERICGTDQTALFGFCSGGVLSALTAAVLAATEQSDKLAAFALGVTVLDYTDAGVPGALVDRNLATAAKAASQRKDYLDGRNLAEVFAWLRPGHLVWNYWVNNYLLGRTPAAFDVLFWNADTTRMSAALHADFVDVALDNSIARPGALTVRGVPVDLSRVELDTYLVAGVADHLTPWEACYRSTRLLGGTSRFILSTSGHIAALVNPPGNPKSTYRVNTANPADPKAWLAGAETVQGSWWPDAAAWFAERCGPDRAAPEKLGGAGLEPLVDAPGTYVFDS